MSNQYIVKQIKNISNLLKIKYERLYKRQKSSYICNYNDLFHITSWETPEMGSLIFVEYEDHSKEILRMNSDVDTDEIIGWCYLDDLI